MGLNPLQISSKAPPSEKPKINSTHRQMVWDTSGWRSPRIAVCQDNFCFLSSDIPTTKGKRPFVIAGLQTQSRGIISAHLLPALGEYLKEHKKRFYI